MRRPLLLLPLLVVCTTVFAQTQGGPIPVPLPLFPPNNWWNTDISSAPLDPGSAAYIAFINAPSAPNFRRLHPDFGGDAGGGEIFGIPYIVVEGSQAKKSVEFFYPDESDGVNHDTETSFPFYPIPDQAITQNGWIEGGLPGNVDQPGDRHMLIVDRTNNHLYELFDLFYNGTGWEAGSGAFFDMNTNNRRPETWTSADAAGLAILPGLVRYDEVFGPDEIRHAFRVTVRATNGHVFPASHTAGSTSGALPMGARLRLKESKDISAHPAYIQKIFRAMKKYGLIVADNGSDMFISGVYDTRWDNGQLNPAFRSLNASDFEVVRLGWKPPISLVLTIPSGVGAGDATSATLTAYDANYNLATGYTGTVQFMSTDGAATLPLSYTFTPADAGTHTFPGGFTLRTPGSQIVSMRDVADFTITGSRGVTVGPPTPVNVVATATTTTSVNVSWNPSTGAMQYEVMRASAGSPYATVLTTPATSFTDAVAAGNAYLYKVKAIDAASRSSAFSTPDPATTFAFTDDPLIVNTTLLKSTHILEIRQAINSLRSATALGAFSFTDASLASVAAKAIHIDELRTALAQARAAAGVPALVLTDPAIFSGLAIKAAHVQELRSGLQ